MANTEKKMPANVRAMNAAINCFSEQGIHKTNMEDVAKQAGMARSTLYRYFKDRDELIMAVVEREAINMASDIGAHIAHYSNISAYIIEGMILAIDHIEKNPLLSKLFDGDATSIANRLLLTGNQIQTVGIETLKELIEPAQKSGLLRKEISVEKVMDWLLRVLISLITVPSEFTKTEQGKRELLQDMLLPVLVEQSNNM